jgi:hypothetical protein
MPETKTSYSHLAEKRRGLYVKSERSGGEQKESTRREKREERERASGLVSGPGGRGWQARAARENDSGTRHGRGPASWSPSSPLGEAIQQPSKLLLYLGPFFRTINCSSFRRRLLNFPIHDASPLHPSSTQASPHTSQHCIPQFRHHPRRSASPCTLKHSTSPASWQLESPCWHRVQLPWPQLCS